jgi:hypothetical protein
MDCQNSTKRNEKSKEDSDSLFPAVHSIQSSFLTSKEDDMGEKKTKMFGIEATFEANFSFKVKAKTEAEAREIVRDLLSEEIVKSDYDFGSLLHINEIIEFTK